MATLDDPLTVSIHDACEITGLSRTTLWRRIKANSLKAKRVDGRTLINYASLKALVTEPEAA
jgi:excisionase family DNA binding protein